MVSLKISIIHFLNWPESILISSGRWRKNRWALPGVKLSNHVALRQVEGPPSCESICLKHIRQIKKALEIGAVYTEISAWRAKPVSGDKGAQIDLLIDRQDRCINVCEIKYSSGEFTIDRKYQEELSDKLNVFRAQTKTNKTLFLTMITTFGVKENIYKTQMVQNELTMNELFM